MQPVLGPAFQYVFRSLRPFRLMQIGDFTLIEQGAEVPPEVADRPCPVKETMGHAAIEARIVNGKRCGKPRIAPAEILDKGFDRKRNSFVQYYGTTDLDASLLLIPQLGFLPAKDPRVLGTIAAIERELVHDGLVCRYVTRPKTDGLPTGEGVFLPCSCWLAMSGSASSSRRIASLSR